MGMSVTTVNQHQYQLQGGIEALIEKQATQEKEGLAIASNHAMVSISDEGKKLLEENGGVFGGMTREEMAAVFGEELTELPEPEPIFQYGYDQELDAVSADFKNAFKELIIGRNAGSGIKYDSIDYSIIDKLNQKYKDMKNGIEKDYSGEEQEGRLAELDRAYSKIFQDNIIKPVSSQLEASMDVNQPKGTLVRISGSQAFINSYYANEAAGKETYKQLSKVNEQLTAFTNQGINEWLNGGKAKSGLNNIIKALIDVTGTSQQREGIKSINVSV